MINIPPHSEVSDLRSLISRLEKMQKIPNVKYPKCLIKSLKQLSDVEGMAVLKSKIAKQTSFIIFNPIFQKGTHPMLNTILYGSPGVGKTKVAIILAKIWSSIGILGKDVSSLEKLELQRGIKTEGQRNYLYLTFILFGLYIVYMAYTLIVASIKDSKKMEAIGVDTKPFKIANYIFIFVLGVVLISYLIFTKYKSSKNYLQRWENNEVEDISSSDVIDIISRDDLVSGYLGQTAIKTREILTKSIGKVLFIDEAYSIVTSNHDPYGTEALNTINLFLSQHPGKVIVIMAGYKKLMMDRLFSSQPGLPRRFMWHFSIDGYSSEELKNIFEKQLSLQGMKIDSDEVISLFEEEKDTFSNYGGDTERLVFYIQINKSFAEGNVDFEKVSLSEIRKGIRDLKQNKEEENSSSLLDEKRKILEEGVENLLSEYIPSKK